MNNIWFKIITYFSLLVVIFISGYLIKGCSNKPDFKQSNSNLISQDSSREIIYTQKEFDEKIKHATDSLNKVNIPKTKTITKYLKQHLTASDSQIFY